MEIRRKSHITLVYYFVSVFFLVLPVFGGNCTERVHPPSSGFVGGYMPMEDPQSDPVVQDIVAKSGIEFNKMSNDLLQFSYSRIQKAYKQLVNGLNYCVLFELGSTGCKNDLNSDFCQNKKKLNCVVSAYQGFSDPIAKIDSNGLFCTAVI